MATCVDKILCENAFGCDITILDTEGNPIDPLNLNNGDSVVFVLGDKPGYNFRGWVDEDGNPYYYDTIGDNRYLIRNIDCSKQYIAKYCAIQYTVNVTSASDCFTPYSVHTYYGHTVTIQASDSFRCRFLNWTKDGVLYSEENRFEYVVTEDTTFVANYDTIKYRITAKPNHMNRGTCTGSGEYNLNQNVQLSATANTGYRFDGWEDGITSPTRTVTVRGNKTYTAVFSVRENVVYSPPTSGGSVIGSGTHTTGTPVSLQAVPQAGWEFSHWEVDGQTYTDRNLNFVAKGDVTAVPYFTKSGYSVSFVASPQGLGYFTPSPAASYEYGDTFTIEAVPNSGCSFVGWKDGFTQPRRDITVLDNTEYVALFEQNTSGYLVTVVLPDSTYVCPIYVGYNNVGQRSGSDMVATVLGGTQIRLTPVVPGGKRLVSVTDGDGNVVWSATSESDAVTIPYTVGNENVELTLNFEDVTCDVVVSATPINEDTSGNVQLTVNIGSIYDIFVPTASVLDKTYGGVTYGANAMLSAPSTVGDYVFSYWYTEQGSYNTATVNLTVNGTLKCVAVYRDGSSDNAP